MLFRSSKGEPEDLVPTKRTRSAAGVTHDQTPGELPIITRSFYWLLFENDVNESRVCGAGMVDPPSLSNPLKKNYHYLPSAHVNMSHNGEVTERHSDLPAALSTPQSYS